MKKLLLALSLFYTSSVFAQTAEEVDLVQLIKELQIMKKNDNRFQLVWWLPDAYWDITYKQTKSVSPEVAEEIKAAVKDYVFVCAADMITNGAAGFIYKDEEEIKKQLTMKFGDKAYHPLLSGKS